MKTKPSSSCFAKSPVCSQPPSLIVAAVTVGFLYYSFMTLASLTIRSPSLPVASVLPFYFRFFCEPGRCPAACIRSASSASTTHDSTSCRVDCRSSSWATWPPWPNLHLVLEVGPLPHQAGLGAIQVEDLDLVCVASPQEGIVSLLLLIEVPLEGLLGGRHSLDSVLLQLHLGCCVSLFHINLFHAESFLWLEEVWRSFVVSRQLG